MEQDGAKCWHVYAILHGAIFLKNGICLLSSKLHCKNHLTEVEYTPAALQSLSGIILKTEVGLISITSCMCRVYTTSCLIHTEIKWQCLLHVVICLTCIWRVTYSVSIRNNY